MRLLMKHPDQLEGLRQNPDQIPNAVAEILPRLRNPQFAGPVKYLRSYFINGIREMPITFTPETAQERARLVIRLRSRFLHISRERFQRERLQPRMPASPRHIRR